MGQASKTTEKKNTLVTAHQLYLGANKRYVSLDAEQPGRFLALHIKQQITCRNEAAAIKFVKMFGTGLLSLQSRNTYFLMV